MDSDTIKGAVKETGGEIRAKVDHVLGDKKGEAQGRKDQLEGNVQKNFGKIKDAARDAVDE